ncbi:MAG: hypothetical protein PF636_03810, partial [Actinomycetota bacterium]|nr:hypothetical protein [Actinomycetota bacterium]
IVHLLRRQEACSTARAGAEGTAASFLAPEEMDNLKDLERTTGNIISCADLEGFDYKHRIVPDPNRSAKPVHKSKRPGQGQAHKSRQGSRKRSARRNGGGGQGGNQAKAG